MNEQRPTRSGRNSGRCRSDRHRSRDRFVTADPRRRRGVVGIRNRMYLDVSIEYENEVRHMIHGDVLFDPRVQSVTVRGDCAQQTCSVAVTGQCDRRSRVHWKPRGMRPNADASLGFIGIIYHHVHLQPPFSAHHSSGHDYQTQHP
jgi:hypothetical protein